MHADPMHSLSVGRFEGALANYGSTLDRLGARHAASEIVSDGRVLQETALKLAHDAKTLTADLNRSDWLEPRGIVLAEPLIPYVPR